MTIRTAIKTPEATAPQENKESAYIRALIEDTLIVYTFNSHVQGARRFIDGMHNHPSTAVRTYAYTSQLERELMELVGRRHRHSEFDTMIIDVYTRFAPSA
jgi:hypothetical protein